MLVNSVNGGKQIHNGPLVDGYREDKKKDLGGDGIFGNLAWDIKDPSSKADDLRSKPSGDDKAKLKTVG